MSERREYYRTRVMALLVVEPVAKADEPAARRRLDARRVDPARAPRIEDVGAASEWRQLLEGVSRMAFALERIERRLERLERGPGGRPATLTPGPVEISLSASGLAVDVPLDLEPDDLALLEIDMPDTGLPPVAALGRYVAMGDPEAPASAFHFEQIHPEDRERIVQLGLRMQSHALRAGRAEEERG